MSTREYIAKIGHTHRKTTYFRHFLQVEHIEYMFSYVLKTSAGIKQPTQITVMIFVQLYFEIGVDFSLLLRYN